ncbi:hypothetical protein RRG08_037608 [Elysia crispata]|uniref:Uncharacterized protein n=1 Tax=Elysia crispata TaxID=231223 RepID=A0AAE1CYG1_9GAST|nr:hypothetical protein RRG08_037608 [Elysia crispata]
MSTTPCPLDSSHDYSLQITCSYGGKRKTGRRHCGASGVQAAHSHRDDSFKNKPGSRQGEHQRNQIDRSWGHRPAGTSGNENDRRIQNLIDDIKAGASLVLSRYVIMTLQALDATSRDTYTQH